MMVPQMVHRWLGEGRRGMGGLALGLSIVALLALLVPGVRTATAQGSGPITRVSVASDGTQADYQSYNPAISADGRYVAFESVATNLVSGDNYGSVDIFVHDRETGQTTLVSVASDGTQANSSSWNPSISADGRYVAFESGANNLVPGDTYAHDVFVHDRQTGQTTRVSVASDGTQANSSSWNPSISADGRYVAFESEATNLIGSDLDDDGRCEREEGCDTNNNEDIFVHDRQTGQTTRVSVASDGTEGIGGSGDLSISADGRYVAFISSNLVPGDTNGVGDIFVHDRQTGQTTRVSVASDGTQADLASGDPSISADGRYVAFISNASNLVSGDNTSDYDIFVHDRETGQTTLVSIDPDVPPLGSSSRPSISADGRFVAFGDYVHDRQTGKTTNYCVSLDGKPAACEWTSISADGRFVAFRSIANNLVPDDTNGVEDIFVAGEGCFHTSIRPTSAASASPRRESLPVPLKDFDIRVQEQAPPEVPGKTHIDALQGLKGRLGGTVKVSWNRLNGTPRSLLNYGGYLTQPSAEAPRVIAWDFLERHFDLFGLTRGELANFQVVREYKTKHNGVTHLTFTQYYEEIPIFQAQIKFNIDREGRIVSMGGEYYPGIHIPVVPVLSPADALKAAAGNVAPGVPFEPEILSGPSGPARESVFRKGPFNRTDAFHGASLVIFPMQNQFRLAWQVVFHKNSIERYLVLVEANTGEILYRANLVKFSQPQGLVFEQDPDDAAQVLKSFQGDPVVSPQGWLFRTNGEYSTLGGNHTCTQEDRDANDGGGYSPSAHDGHYEYAFTNAYETSGGSDVETDLDAALTNLFYQVNFMHDYLYSLGFDEAAGNFQRDNFDRGGLGDDEVHADAQDGWGTGTEKLCEDPEGNPILCRNNANFNITPDGFDPTYGKPRMQMYLFTWPFRNIDATFNGGIIIHEYTHGLSDRLVGAGVSPDPLSGIQSGAMGEGWGDWFEASIFDDPVIGEYETGDPTMGDRNYRLDDNPLGYTDLCTGGVPDGPKIECEVHDDGEIWSATLWDLRREFIDTHGYAAGKQQVEQLVVDGMKSSVINPSMLDMRDAILQADLSQGGANQDLIWWVFCQRWMGFSASTDDHNDQYPVGAIDLPDGKVCQVTDLSITKTDSPDPVTVGNKLTYTVVVTNNGPDEATGVTFSDTLPAGVTFGSATPSQGSCNEASPITCNLGILASGTNATVTLVVTPTAPGRLTNSATVTGSEADSDTTNNTATATTKVKRVKSKGKVKTGQLKHLL